jgi:hypothetical protein
MASTLGERVQQSIHDAIYSAFAEAYCIEACNEIINEGAVQSNPATKVQTPYKPLSGRASSADIGARPRANVMPETPCLPFLFNRERPTLHSNLDPRAPCACRRERRGLPGNPHSSWCVETDILSGFL